jgi:hypothetical protein
MLLRASTFVMPDRWATASISSVLFMVGYGEIQVLQGSFSVCSEICNLRAKKSEKTIIFAHRTIN